MASCTKWQNPQACTLDRHSHAGSLFKVIAHILHFFVKVSYSTSCFRIPTGLPAPGDQSKPYTCAAGRRGLDARVYLDTPWLSCKDLLPILQCQQLQLDRNKPLSKPATLENVLHTLTTPTLEPVSSPAGSSVPSSYMLKVCTSCLSSSRAVMASKAPTR